MGTAHEGSQQKPIHTMQLPKEVGTEGPAAVMRPAREGGPRPPLPRVPAGVCGIRHTGRGVVGSWGTRAWTGRVRVRWSPTRAGQGG